MVSLVYWFFHCLLTRDMLVPLGGGMALTDLTMAPSDSRIWICAGETFSVARMMWRRPLRSRVEGLCMSR